MTNRRPSPDDRSDNVEKLQENVQNTIRNIEKSHDAYEFSTDKEKELLRQKNEKREAAIEGMREEIKDEAEDH
ncbi:small acid-soluble spore protein Tlp [Salimicrobium halophilum]|uniref:Small, acid-soluble spore protein Tlp n=1 Tax=Salimicrobium halophilum TaxID=86666 RepID=A0A1G8Q720_9BACI|nr:small acid-soluble spore protein Tlp [Salimicrobium halophilum]SDI99900.1 small acid-soluble spore protein (thioredoxin-like protein) [Salimicrobium halophilum]